MQRKLTKAELSALGEAYAIQLGEEVKELVLAARSVVQAFEKCNDEMLRLREALKPFEGKLECIN